MTNHTHQHGAGCGHMAVRHDDHTDYLENGHLQHQAGATVEEHSIGVGSANPDRCTPDHKCDGHDAAHRHGPGCGHEMVPHGDHQDYLIGGHLHHPHGTHCDDHGPISAG